MSAEPRPSIATRYFPALGRRNFRLFWTGQCVSLVGTWMQNVGQAWLVLQLTRDPAKLGIVSAVQFLPMLILSLFAGPFVDRFPKRKTLIVTQSALMLLALALAILTATGVVRYWMILVLALCLGLVNLIDIPTRQSYVIELCGRDTLVNAVSLNSAAFNLARILGPAVAGTLMELVGIAPCFFLNALSFAAVIAALSAIDAPALPRAPGFRSLRDVVSSTGEGLAYIKARKAIAVPLALLAFISTIVINYNVIVPTFARTSLGRGASGYGFLMTAMGIGSLLAALSLAVRSASPAARERRGGPGPSRTRLFAGAAGMCLALALCGLQRSYWLSCVLLGITGFCTVTFSASTNATIQLGSDDAHRGRVMSVYALVLGGVTPIGALYTGFFIKATSPALCMIVSGLAGLAAALPLAIGAFRRRGRVA